jgi:hypothetical protein
MKFLLILFIGHKRTVHVAVNVTAVLTEAIKLSGEKGSVR